MGQTPRNLWDGLTGFQLKDRWNSHFFCRRIGCFWLSFECSSGNWFLEREIHQGVDLPYISKFVEIQWRLQFLVIWPMQWLRVDYLLLSYTNIESWWFKNRSSMQSDICLIHFKGICTALNLLSNFDNVLHSTLRLLITTVYTESYNFM